RFEPEDQDLKADEQRRGDGRRHVRAAVRRHPFRARDGADVGANPHALQTTAITRHEQLFDSRAGLIHCAAGEQDVVLVNVAQVAGAGRLVRIARSKRRMAGPLRSDADLEAARLDDRLRANRRRAHGERDGERGDRATPRHLPITAMATDPLSPPRGTTITRSTNMTRKLSSTRAVLLKKLS